MTGSNPVHESPDVMLNRYDFVLWLVVVVESSLHMDLKISGLTPEKLCKGWSKNPTE
jgi:hypothetical protein